MTTKQIEHFQSCTAKYPEKVKGEAAQATIVIDLEDGTAVVQCVDCGALVVVPIEEAR